VDIQDSYQTNEIAINWNAALIYALAGFVNYNSAQNEVLYGDVNDDGKVNSTDLTLLKRYVLKAVSTLPSSKAEKNADVNRDGRVNSSDVTILSDI